VEKLSVRNILWISSFTALLGAANALSATWDLAKDFSYSKNPNGVWTYGYAPQVADQLTPYSITVSAPYVTNGGGLTYWASEQRFGLNYLPQLGKWVGDRGAQVNLAYDLILPGNVLELPAGCIRNTAGKVHLHPSDSAVSVAEWVAPSDGYYSISASFVSEDCVVGTTTHVTVMAGGVVMYSENLFGIPGKAGIEKNWKSDATGIFLLKGQIVRVAVGNGGNGFGYDSTGVDLTIRKQVRNGKQD
jgi:hypothetical protein